MHVLVRLIFFDDKCSQLVELAYIIQLGLFLSFFFNLRLLLHLSTRFSLRHVLGLLNNAYTSRGREVNILAMRPRHLRDRAIFRVKVVA